MIHSTSRYGDGPAGEITRHYDQPVLFYALAAGISWVLWGGAAVLSRLPDQTAGVRLGTAALGLAGLAAPAVLVLWLVRNRPDLRVDLRRRLLWQRGVSVPHVACAFLLLLGSILAAQAVSLLFGYSPDQFQWRGGFSFSSGVLPVWMVLLIAPILEELAWHGYGTDALVGRMRLLTASLLFTVIWTLWHVPLAFIEGYYQNEVVESGWVYALNFAVSMVAFVILMNWLYYRTGRSIAVSIVFHITAGFVNEVFMTHPDSKVIQTVLLLALSAVVVWRNPDLFLRRPNAVGRVSQVAQ